VSLCLALSMIFKPPDAGRARASVQGQQGSLPSYGIWSQARLRPSFRPRAMPRGLRFANSRARQRAPHGTSGTNQPHRVHPYPRGGSLCTSSGHSLSTTARISSEMTVTFLMSSMYLCNRRKSAGVIALPPTIRGE